jgi:hypothetical protein
MKVMIGFALVEEMHHRNPRLKEMGKYYFYSNEDLSNETFNCNTRKHM